jgi:hypothetical protein
VTTPNEWAPPRRICINRLTPAELAIRKAVSEVEMAGTHPLLTEAVTLLQQARGKVADYVDGEGSNHTRGQ